MLSLTIGSVTITDDGSGDYDLVSWNPGRIEADNYVSEARWMNGGHLAATRKRIATMDLVVRVSGTDQADCLDHVDVLTDILDGFDYQVTETIDGVTNTWDCLPASYAAARDPILLAESIITLTASIPRQPLTTAGS